MKLVVEPGMTWTSIAYKYLGAGNRFRDLLNSNPQYHELDQPSPGDIINIPNDQIIESTIAEAPYPWLDFNNYLQRLSTYHDFAINNVDDCNGDTLTPATMASVEPSTTDTPSTIQFSLL